MPDMPLLSENCNAFTALGVTLSTARLSAYQSGISSAESGISGIVLSSSKAPYMVVNNSGNATYRGI